MSELHLFNNIYWKGFPFWARIVSLPAYPFLVFVFWIKDVFDKQPAKEVKK